MDGSYVERIEVNVTLETEIRAARARLAQPVAHETV